MRSLLLGMLLLVAASALAFEQIGISDAALESPVEISAQRLGNVEGETVEASGQVTVIWGRQRLTADQIRYNRSTRVVEAKGSVRIVDEGGNELTCAAATLDLSTLTGSTEEAELFLAEPGYRLKAQRIRRTGQRTFEAEEAFFTACDGSFPSWSIEAGHIEVEVEGYLWGRNGIFRIEALPAAYLPAFVLPAKISRQSGLLPPKLGSSEADGLIFINRVYWVLSESADLVLAVDYRSRRGFREEARLRYVLDRNQEGELRLALYNDRQGDRVEHLDVLADHVSFLSPETLLEYHVDYTGEPESRRAYGDDLETRGVRRAESHASLSHAFAPGSAYVLGRFTQPFSQSQSEVQQALPSLGFWGIDTPLWGPLYAGLSSDATRFYREDGLDGARGRLLPRLKAEADLGPLGLTAAAGWRQHFYQVLRRDAQATADAEEGHGARGAAWAELAARLLLERPYGALLHRVEPYATFSWAEAGRGMKSVPDFDDADRFAHESLLRLGVESRLSDRFSLDVERSLDLGAVRDDGYSDDAWRPWRAELEASLGDFLELSAEGDYDDGWLSWAAEATARDGRGDKLWWRQQYLRSEAGYLETGLTVPLTARTTVSGLNRYSRRDRRILEDRVEFTYLHACWEGTLGFSRLYRDEEDDYDRRVLLTVSLKGLGQTGKLSW